MITSIRSVGRLFWRPAAISAFVFLAFAAAWSVIQAGVRLGDDYPMTTAPAIAAIFWNGSILFMGALGLGFALVTAHLNQSLFAFSVPSLRDRIARGTIAVGVTFAVLIASVVAFTAGVVDGIGSLVASLLFFALALSTFDRTRSRLLSGVGFVLVMVVAFKVHWAPMVFHISPVLVAMGSLLGAGALIRRELSVETARVRALAPPPIAVFGGFGQRRIDQDFRESHERFFEGRPSCDRLIEWVKAIDYENFGHTKGGWLQFVAGSAIAISAIGYFSNSTLMVGFFGMQSGAFMASRLGRWRYPTSRSRQADAAFVASAINSVAYFTLAATLVWLFGKTGVPHIGFFDGVRPGRDGPDLVGAAFIWAPLPLWRGITHPIIKTSLKSDPLQFFSLMGFVLLALFLVVPTAFVLKTAAGGNAIAWVGIAAFAGSIAYGVYWLALRRHFRGHDLI